MEFNSELELLKSGDYYDGEIPFQTKVNNKIEAFSTEKCGEIFIGGNNGFSFLCTICDSMIPDLEEFGAHIQQLHYKIYFGDPDCDQNSDNENENNSTSVTSCKENISIISDINGIEMQLLDVCDEEIKLEIPNVAINTDTLKENATLKRKKRNKEKTEICKICNVAFYTQKTLNLHMIYDHKPSDPFYELAKNKNQPDLQSEESENEEKSKTQSEEKLQDPLQCTYCDRRLKSRGERFEHECIHTGERPYKCDVCEKCFRVKKTLNIHKLTHSDDRTRYECELCDKSFTIKSNLNHHIRVHKGDFKYKCNYCEKLFSQNTQRRTHERIHTGEKPFQCNTCGQCFTTSSKLSAHNKRHSGTRPHKCEHCEKAFYSKEALRNHTVIHTKERPFTCEICKATFPRMFTLRAHKKLHSDVAQYVCKICGKGFKQGPGLYSHMKTHEKITNES